MEENYPQMDTDKHGFKKDGNDKTSIKIIDLSRFICIHLCESAVKNCFLFCAILRLFAAKNLTASDLH
jgi:hypothetical protein